MNPNIDIDLSTVDISISQPNKRTKYSSVEFMMNQDISQDVKDLGSLLEHGTADGPKSIIFDFIGKGSFRYVAPTSKKIYNTYKSNGFGNQTFISEAALSIHRAKIFLYESRIKGSNVNTTIKEQDHNMDTLFLLRWYCAYTGNIDVLRSTMKITLNHIFMYPDRDEALLKISLKKDFCAFVEAAACRGRIDVLQFLHTLGYPIPVESSNCTRASLSCCSISIKAGHFKCLKYLHRQGWNLDKDCYIEAVRGRKLKLLNYLIKNKCPRSESICSLAASLGNIEYLEIFHRNNFPWDEESCTEAASKGHLDCLEFLHSHGCQWNERMCVFGAAYGGHLKCLEFLHSHGCQFDSGICAETAARGHLNCLRFLHEQSCPWDEESCGRAAAGGHLHCLRFLHEKSCPWDEECFYYAISGKSLPCLKFLYEKGCPRYEEGKCLLVAIRFCHLESLRYFHENGYQLSAQCFHEAVTAVGFDWADREILKYLHDNKCPFDDYSYSEAIKYRKWSIVRFFVKHGYPMSSKHLELAVSKTNDDQMLQFFHEHGFEFTEKCSSDAAQLGNFDSLYYLVENGHAFNAIECITNLIHFLKTFYINPSDPISILLKTRVPRIVATIKYLKEKGNIDDETFRKEFDDVFDVVFSQVNLSLDTR
ncbi:hypothetical protein CTEN210_13682 [Chaetoceros tenuissimus]|uniref:Uncharacterized protein n=1 Tax=Chaetoceros tenuissimus TaxID=426638 RepID=A0AAD3D3J7_9STRA|nr:hypothetical protein CTEN210_13682 [Chaetoceros tenuissimus]